MKGGEVETSDGIAVAYNSGGSSNWRVDPIGNGDGNGLTVVDASGGSRDGNGGLFCCVEESITTVIDGNRDGGRNPINR